MSDTVQHWTFRDASIHRIRLQIEYDGTAYSGWQRQINAPSVQQTLEEALRALTREPELVVFGASRTDAGVHALGQVAHFDTAARIPPEKYAYALNTLLPADIRVVSSMGAAADFHARFHAQRKQYRYWFHCAPHSSALMRNMTMHVIYPVDVGRMRSALSLLIGTHDFAAFAASGSCVKDTVRTIYEARLVEEGENLALYIEGNGFLYNMVRIIAGTLIGIGTGKLEPDAFARALATGDRLSLGVTAPARGLTLMWIRYDETRGTNYSSVPAGSGAAPQCAL